MVLEDNSEEVLLDPTLEYKAEIETHPYGLSLSETDIFEESLVSGNLYLAIAANTTHPEACLEYIRYLYGLDSTGYTPKES
jgi:hypothetical protein